MTDLAQSLSELYTGCMNCTTSEAVCPGVWKDIARGIPPRGFFSKMAPVKLLAVAKNPGHPLEGERDRLRGRTGGDLFRAYRAFQESFYPDPGQIREPSTRFHTTLFRYLCFFVDIPRPDIYLHVAHTNLVKCSTPDEQAKLIERTTAQCYEQCFRREV